MSTIITASNLPSSVTGAAGTYVLPSILNLPAGVVNRPIKVRVRGSLLLGPGSAFGTASIAAIVQGSNGAFGDSLFSGTYNLDQDSPSILQFRGAGQIAAIPFLGRYADVNNCSAFLGEGPAYEQSNFSIGEKASSSETSEPSLAVQYAGPLGDGTWTFASATPLVVRVTFANPSWIPNSVLGPITASLSEFSLEY